MKSTKQHSVFSVPSVVGFVICTVLAATAQSVHAQSAPATASTSAPATKTISVTATLEALDTADLYAKDAGYLSAVQADLGDHVKQGQVLAIIDDPELQKQVESSQATLEARKQMALAAEAYVQQAERNRDVVRSNLAGYQAEEALAQATLKRQEDTTTRVISVQELDEVRAKVKVAAAQTMAAQARIAAADADVTAAQANLAVARSQVTVANAELQRLQTLLQYTKVTAPFDGVITRRLVSTGDMMQSGATASRATPLFTCQRIDTIRVFCDVPEAQIAAISPGTTASVRIFALDNLAVAGTVTRIATSLNPTTRTMRAEIDLPNPNEKLRPGMYAQVTLTLGK